MKCIRKDSEMKTKKNIVNISLPIVQQIVSVLCGLVLPRLIINVYGSQINGLLSSITQFLSFISFMQLGVGAVAQAAWYKPLYEKDTVKVSQIYVSAEKFFRTIAIFFIGYVLILCFVYPRIVNVNFSNLYVILLILIVAVNMFSQYYFGLTNQLLLIADQRAYIPIILQIIVTILNTVISVYLILSGASIHAMKLVTSIIGLITPFFMHIYVNRKYKINRKMRYDEEPIKQKWNGCMQHISSVIMDNADVIVLSIFSTLINVSIYNVYNLVFNGVRQLILAAFNSIQSIYGKSIAEGNMGATNELFSKSEKITHFIIVILFACTMSLCWPFINIYTSSITDADYKAPMFMIIKILSQIIFCMRTIYYTLIKAAGHFKETQGSAFVEMILNLIISIIAVKRYGLVGVAIGTFIASLYRLLYCVNYLIKNILFRKSSYFLKLICKDMGIYILLLLINSKIVFVKNNLGVFFLNALVIFIADIVISLLFEYCYLKITTKIVETRH